MAPENVTTKSPSSNFPFGAPPPSLSNGGPATSLSNGGPATSLSNGGPPPLLSVVGLNKTFARKGAKSADTSVYALRDINLEVYPGETLGIVGESGCGKTTLGRSLVRLYTPDSGQIFAEGKDIAHIQGRELSDYRRMVQMVFQDPFASLNPRMKIRDCLLEPLQIAKWGNKTTREARIRELMTMVNLPPDNLDRYPHQFSGGQRQRIGIARALAINPRVIIADEPVSALDVSVQAQVLNIIMDLREKSGLTLIFISHDLGVIAHVSQRVAVMYLGSIVELSPTAELYKAPMHPYTQILLAAVPTLDDDAPLVRQTKVNEPPTSAMRLSSCPFVTRCAFAQDRCSHELPALRPLAGADRKVACHFAEEIHAKRL